jgi:hypothetical protein
MGHLVRVVSTIYPSDPFGHPTAMMRQDRSAVVGGLPPMALSCQERGGG